jgi:hypothetical protein
MSGQFLKLASNLAGVAFLVLRFLKQYGLRTYTGFILFFIVTGCASLHVDISPTVDWGHVSVIEFRSPLQDPWELTQPIKSELKAMGFQIEETPANPDLLFSYFTQEGPDLTAESEVLTRLKSLHVQFMDPATKTLVTAVDYFYPEVTAPMTPETGVKEVFSGLRQQIYQESNSQADKPAIVPTQIVPVAPVAVAPPTQSQELQPVPLKLDPVPSSNESEGNAVNGGQSGHGEVAESSQKKVTSVLEKTDKKPHQPVQKTRSPWLPKLQSWGFEDWGKDSADDY